MLVGETVSGRTSTVVVVVCAFVAVRVLKVYKLAKHALFWDIGSTDVVPGVTVTLKYEEQSAVPCLVVKAEAMTARR